MSDPNRHWDNNKNGELTVVQWKLNWIEKMIVKLMSNIFKELICIQNLLKEVVTDVYKWLTVDMMNVNIWSMIEKTPHLHQKRKRE